MTSNSKNYLIAFLACTTLAAVGFALQQRQLLAEAKAAPTLKITQSNFGPRPTQPLTDPKPAAAPSPAPSDESSAPLLSDAAPSADGRPAGGGPGQGRGNWGARMAELMKDPEFVAAMKVEQEARIDQRYGDLFKQLNLPADKLAALKTLLADRENARRDVWATAMSQGLDPRNQENRDKLRELTNQMQAEVDNSIKTSLGEATYAQLQAYNSSQPQRATIGTLNQKLAITGQPLSDSQSQQLTRILSETGTVTGRNVLITDQTISVAKGVLMPSQVAQLEKLKAEQAAQQLIESKTRGANGNGGGRQRGPN